MSADNKGEAINNEAKTLNTAVALFMKDLFSVCDRGLVLTLIQQHIIDIHSDNSLLLMLSKLNFLSVITDYEHYIPLNLPTSIKIESIPNLFSHFW